MFMSHVGTPREWLQGLLHADPEIRHASKLAIGDLTPADDVSIEAFLDALESDNETLVFWSVTALGSLGAHSLAAVQALARLCQRHHAFGVRQCSLHALSKIDPSAPEAKAAFLAALGDDNPSVRREALHACIAVPNLAASDIARIGALANDPDETVAAWSEVALRNIGLRSKHGHAP
jgi:HEAT repeat protein